MKTAQLLNALQQIPHKTTYFGPQGFALPNSDDELKQFQQGFSIHPDGTSLTGVNAGDWQKNWLVIAIDTELGDPYFVDTSLEQLPVFTAMHGEGGWQIDAVASSLNSFLACLKLLIKHGRQTAAQFVPDETSITNPNILTQLQSELIQASGCKDFWSLFFDCYFDWLEED